MQRREFITAAVGMAAGVASASQAFAQDYPDVGAIKKMPIGEGAAGSCEDGYRRGSGSCEERYH
jgi:hypothetical protein